VPPTSPQKPLASEPRPERTIDPIIDDAFYSIDPIPPDDED
jgi:hypothetical protein